MYKVQLNYAKSFPGGRTLNFRKQVDLPFVPFVGLTIHCPSDSDSDVDDFDFEVDEHSIYWNCVGNQFELFNGSDWPAADEDVASAEISAMKFLGWELLEM